MTKLTRPSVLAFRSKILCSDAIMSSCNWDDRVTAVNTKAVNVKEKSVRGTISHELKGAKAGKIESEIDKANLQTIDSAALPFSHDTLRVDFSMRFLGDIASPSSCNSPDFQKALAKTVDNYGKNIGFNELAMRYAINIANGRFLWNNRIGAEAVEVRVTTKGKTFTFNALDIPHADFSTGNPELIELGQILEAALQENKTALVKVQAFALIGSGQAIYPSEELVLNLDKKDKSKILYQLDGQAAMHSQKIGNAIRTIDNWYNKDEDTYPIAVEVYGSVTTQGVAHRDPKTKTDFYNILKQWLINQKEPSVEEQHYFMAMLIRGGVFGG